MTTLISHEPMTEVLGHPVSHSYHAPVLVHRPHCRCAAWWALVDLLGALVVFLVLMLTLMHIPSVMR